MHSNGYGLNKKPEIMKVTDKQIKELKQLLWIFDSKHSASVPKTQENINYMVDEIVKLFAIPDVVDQNEQYCEHAVTDQKTLRCTCCEECGEILDVLD